jgi:hypothetical protein
MKIFEKNKSNGLLALAAQQAPQSTPAASQPVTAPASAPVAFGGSGIRQMGFKNVSDGKKVTGFQVPVCNSYYRGTYLALTEYFEVTVDGEKFAKDKITCTIGSETLTQDKLAGSKIHWPFMEPIILNVNKPGGLKPGLHQVSVEYPQWISYMPTPRSVRKFSAKLAITI